MAMDRDIDGILAPCIADEDVREYVRGMVEAWDHEDADKDELSEMLFPLLEGEGCLGDDASAVVDALWDAIVPDASSTARASFVPLAEGPVLLDAISKIQLHPHDEARLKQGKSTITEMSETFTVSSEKDLQRLEKLEKKQKEKQMAAYEEHKKQLDETLRAKSFRKMRFVGGPAVRDLCLESISVSNGGAELIGDCDVTLVWGRKYGLVGRNGAGKSTFLRWVFVMTSRAFILTLSLALFASLVRSFARSLGR
jgi:ATP-binding cassette subfamily F protein 3